MRRSSQGQRIVFRLPPYDTPRAARCNKAKFRVHRRHAAGGVCEQRNTALRKYIYRYEHEATQKPISGNNIGAPLAPQKFFAKCEASIGCDQPYRRQKASWYAPLCRVEPYRSSGITMIQLDASSSIGSSAECSSAAGNSDFSAVATS